MAKRVEPVRIRIDPQGGPYQGLLNGLNRLREDLGVKLRVFHLMDGNARQWWLARDPLLNGVMELARAALGIPEGTRDGQG